MDIEKKIIIPLCEKPGCEKPGYKISNCAKYFKDIIFILIQQESEHIVTLEGWSNFKLQILNLQSFKTF